MINEEPEGVDDQDETNDFDEWDLSQYLENE